MWFLGSGPGRGQSSVEWGEILSVRLSVRSSVCPSVPPRASQLALRASQLALGPSQLAPRFTQLNPRPSQRCSFLRGSPSLLRGPPNWIQGPQTPLACLRPLLQGLIPPPTGKRRTDGISPHSTGLRPLPGPLPCYH